MVGGSSFASDTLAVLVIYELPVFHSSTFRTLEQSLRVANKKIEIIIYDNSRVAQPISGSEHWTVTYIHDPNNGGVSKAYNKGFQLAIERKKKWLWLLDQDDVFGEQTIPYYEKALTSYPKEMIFAPMVVDEKSLVSPFKMRFGGGMRLQKIESGIHPLQKFLLINAGLLVSASAFGDAGGYDEHFPLDFSDLDFIHRLRKKNDRFVVIPTVVKHSLSIRSVQPLQNRLNRFQVYLHAATIFKKKYKKASRSIVIRSFIMAFRLAWLHKSFQFLYAYGTFLKKQFTRNVI